MPRVGLCSRIQKGWLPLAFCGAFTQFHIYEFPLEEYIQMYHCISWYIPPGVIEIAETDDIAR